LAQVRIRDRQELDFVGNRTCTCTWLAPVLSCMCLPCHAILESANKAAHSSSQPRVFPDSCHPDTFSMKINKDPKDDRSRYKRDLPRSPLPWGKNRKWEDGPVNFQDGRWALDLPFRHPPYSTVSFSPSESARRQREILPAQTPGLWASGFGFGSRDRQSPSSRSTFIHLYPLAVSSNIDCAVLQLLHLQNPSNLVPHTLAPKV
jgi:hypothetical protein